MSMRIEWATTSADVELLERGEKLSGYPEPVANFGLLLSHDNDGFMIEGTKDELLIFLDKARRMVAEDARCFHDDVDINPRNNNEWHCRDCGYHEV